MLLAVGLSLGEERERDVAVAVVLDAAHSTAIPVFRPRDCWSRHYWQVEESGIVSCSAGGRGAAMIGICGRMVILVARESSGCIRDESEAPGWSGRGAAVYAGGCLGEDTTMVETRHT